MHDLHIWTVTDGIESASVHVVIAEDADWPVVLDCTRELLASGYGVTHATIQVEPHDHDEQATTDFGSTVSTPVASTT